MRPCLKKKKNQQQANNNHKNLEPNKRQAEDQDMQLNRVTWAPFGGLTFEQGMSFRQGSEIRVFIPFRVANEGCNVTLDVATDSQSWCPCTAGWTRGELVSSLWAFRVEACPSMGG
jgi:hypothetical protein